MRPGQIMEEKVKVSVYNCASYEAAAIRAALPPLMAELGGISRFIKPGATVLLKPNLLSPRTPEQAVTTHPAVVAEVARLCLQAGAARVWLGDSCAGDHTDEELWEKTGMLTALQELPVVFKSCQEPVAARQIGSRQVPVPGWLEEVDTIISLPKLKTHSLTLLTCGIKNMYGLVSGQAKSAYHGTHPSPRRMSAFLAELYEAFTPDLTIVDAIVAMEGEGPANGDPKPIGLLMAGPDAVAIDAVCASFLKLAPDKIPLIREAAARGCGIARTERIEVVGEGKNDLAEARLRPSLGRVLMRIPEPIFKIVTRLIKCQPGIDQRLCIRCGVCQRICSREAIKEDKHGRLRVDPGRCIVCMCCAESCPYNAVSTRPLMTSLRHLFKYLKLR